MVGVAPVDRPREQTAASLLAFVEQLLMAKKLALEAPHQRLLEQTQAALRARLDEATLIEAQASGRQMSLEQAMVLALESSTS
jgi:hypothetical protein